jgi:hypothetical protein
MWCLWHLSVFGMILEWTASGLSKSCQPPVCNPTPQNLNDTPASKEQSDGVLQELRGGVGVVSKHLDFLTIFNTLEKDFRRIMGGIHTSE